MKNFKTDLRKLNLIKISVKVFIINLVDKNNLISHTLKLEIETSISPLVSMI